MAATLSAETGYIPGVTNFAVFVSQAFLIAYAPTEMERLTDGDIDTEDTLSPMVVTFLVVGTELSRTAVDGIDDAVVPNIVGVIRISITGTGIETVTVMLVAKDVKVHTDAEVRRGSLEMGMLCVVFGICLTDTDLDDREPAVFEVQPCGDLILSVIGEDASAGAEEIGGYSDTAEEGRGILFFHLRLAVLGLRTEGQEDATQKDADKGRNVWLSDHSSQKKYEW